MYVLLFPVSERDPLSGVQTGVFGGRCGGKHLCEGFSRSSQQHYGKDSAGQWHMALPYGGSLATSIYHYHSQHFSGLDLVASYY